MCVLKGLLRSIQSIRVASRKFKADRQYCVLELHRDKAIR